MTSPVPQLPSKWASLMRGNNQRWRSVEISLDSLASLHCLRSRVSSVPSVVFARCGCSMKNSIVTQCGHNKKWKNVYESSPGNEMSSWTSEFNFIHSTHLFHRLRLTSSPFLSRALSRSSCVCTVYNYNYTTWYYWDLYRILCLKGKLLRLFCGLVRGHITSLLSLFLDITRKKTNKK